MKTFKAIPAMLGLAALVLSLPGHALAVAPIGLNAIEQFDWISKLRQGVRTYQYSSHDPSGGNDDRGHFLYVDGTEKVMLDVKGPGCIYRFWMTSMTPGRIRLYFDGSSTPLFDLDREEFFTGTHAPFLAPLVGNNVVSSGGYYCYLPMPFREGCKMTITGDDHYYNITYHRFADAAGVTTFTGTESSAAARSLWNSVGTDPKPDHGQVTLTNTVNLPIGTLITMADLTTSGIIQEVQLNIPGLAPDEASKAILSSLRLECYWDGSPQAAVNVPIGSFFGSGLRAKRVAALPVGIDGQRLYCFFPMPFASKALLRLRNTGNIGVNNVTYTVRYSALPGAAENAGCFHAKFMSETPTTTGRDYLILSETGSGHFAGVVQTWDARLTDRWHLEGDERIYVDGRLTPSLYGTGTEDFYNGGWYFSHGTFTLPVHGCPDRDPPLPDPPKPLLDTCYRFFLSDLIPFTTSIRVGIEHGPGNDVNVDIQSVAFYYKSSQPLASLTDELNVGNSTSESAHGYVASGSTWSGSTSGSYEGDDDNVTVNDTGRRLSGGSTFTVAVAPAENAGVLLRRRMDYSRPHQEARVYVDDVLVGIWYEPGENDYHVFRDAEFLVPPSLTQNKSTITIRIENISPYSNWTEYRYWIYTLRALQPSITLAPQTLSPVTTYAIVPPDDMFTVTNLDGGTLEYTVTDDADWLSVSPETGTSTGESDTIHVIYDTADLPVGVYQATITVADDDALNSPQTIAVTLKVKPIPGDFDADYDVDQADFGHFQICLSGGGYPQNNPDCLDARFDTDEDVDQVDFAIFKNCLSGPNIPANPHCAN